MNKTIKTIAWICLVLGLLGVAVDVGVYVRGRVWVSQMQEAMVSGEMPASGGRFTDIDEDSDADTDDLQPRRASRDSKFKFGVRGGWNGFDHPVMRDRFAGFSHGLIAAPLFFLAAGPILTVVGAVMLLVNRDPRQKNEEKNKAKAEKTKS